MQKNRFNYTRDALTGKWTRWILLAVLSFLQALTFSLVPLFSGYLVRVLSGKTPAPEVDDWGRLFVDGWKWNIINLIYMIPVLLILAYFGGLAVLSAIGVQGAADPEAWAPAVAAALSGILLAMLVAILISFVSLFAVVRFAHTGRIGWGSWILAVIILILIGLVYSILVGVLGYIPVLGWIIGLFLGVAFGIFHARYLAGVYESTGELG